jgi:hypothetical protein
MNTYIWIGKYESDILTNNNYFDYSITYYGSNTKNNVAFCSEKRLLSTNDDKYVDFVINHIDKIKIKHPNILLYFYSSGIAYKIQKLRPDFICYCKCLNQEQLINWLNNKTFVRCWLSNSVNVPSFALLSKPECTYNNLSSLFPDYKKFVIQENISSGGDGTYLINQNNEKCILQKLFSYRPYLVSAYYESISISSHLIISDNINIIFPVCIQKINNKSNKLKYGGADFTILKEFDDRIKILIYKTSNIIANRLSSIGYKGICGLDFIIFKEKILFIEINPRFLGSSFVINKCLSENNLPNLFILNEWAFNNDNLINNYKTNLENLNIPYRSHVVKSIDEWNNLKETGVLRRINKNNLFYDGCEHASYFESGVYIMRFIES